MTSVSLTRAEYERLTHRVDTHGERLAKVETYTQQHSNDLQTLTEQMSELLTSVHASRQETRRRFDQLHNWRTYFIIGISGVSSGACGAVFWALSHFFR